jgi:hypothetical protein
MGEHILSLLFLKLLNIFYCITAMSHYGTYPFLIYSKGYSHSLADLDVLSL